MVESVMHSKSNVTLLEMSLELRLYLGQLQQSHNPMSLSVLQFPQESNLKTRTPASLFCNYYEK